MSDTRLRKLERRWQATGEVEDEAAYLVERLRVGELDSARLELAAYCRHAAACRAVGGDPPAPIDNLRDWAGGVSRWGRVCELIVAFTCADQALADAAEADVDPKLRAAGCALAEKALAAARAFLDQPSNESFSRCAGASASAAFAWQETRLNEFHPFCVENACQEALGRSNRNTGRYFAMSAYYLSLVLGKEVAVAVMCQDLIAFALGEAHSRGPQSQAEEISDNGRRRIYRVLCNLAACDGVIDPAEREVLQATRVLFEIPLEEAHALEREGLQNTKLKVGSRRAEQECLVAFMVDVAAADGRLDPAELKRLRRVVESLGLSQLELHARLLRHFPEILERNEPEGGAG